MDETEDDARYPPDPYSLDQDYESSHQQKLPVPDSTYPQQYDIDNGDDLDGDDANDENVQAEEENEEEDGGEDEHNGIQTNGNGENDDENDNGDEDNGDNRSDYSRKIENADIQRRQKKRKLKSLLSNYEFAPRVSAPSAAAGSVPKPTLGGRNSIPDWTEHESIVLLDAWGERYIHRGRKSLRSDEWQEVADAVSLGSKFNRTDTQCRNRLDTLKKKYKKEKLRVEGAVGATSKWVYFKKMDMLMSSSPPKTAPLCGAGKGEYIRKNPRAGLNRPNVVEKTRGSEGNSESAEGDDDDDEDLVRPRRTRSEGNGGNGDSYRLLADSIYKFSDIYEKIETSKRKQMVELEKMRMDFHRDLELQKRQMLERVQAEIAKIRQEEDEDNDASAENIS